MAMDGSCLTASPGSGGEGEPMLVINGVDATTGEYLLAPIKEADLTKQVLGAETEARTFSALRARHRRRTEDHLAPRFGVDETDLSQAGWGLVLPVDADPRLRSALQPLLDLRRSQASARSEHLYREFLGEQGYRHGESKDDFLGRQGAGPGPVRPEVVPYYLLLVGGPDEIPFEFQYQLGVQYAVGRLAFDGSSSTPSTRPTWWPQSNGVIRPDHGGSRYLPRARTRIRPPS